MAADSLTLALDGEVAIDDFDHAVTAFRKLIKAVTKEVVGRTRVDWLIDDLSPSSAILAVRPRSDDVGVEAMFDEIVARIDSVGEALEEDDVDHLPPNIARPARTLVWLAERRVQRVRLVTPLGDRYIERPSDAPMSLPPVLGHTAIGAVRGRMQTLSNRGGLRFTLFDLMFDKAVSCYLEPGLEEQLKDLWGQLVTVEGTVTRDASGRPTSVRHVLSVTRLPERSGDAYQRARGAVRLASDRRPEDIIREMRDSG